MPEKGSAGPVDTLRKADDIDDVLPQSASLYGFRLTGTLAPAELPARPVSERFSLYL